jgi:hypothetical protein
MKFFCKFSKTISVHLEVSDTPPTTGQIPDWKFRYHGSVIGKHFGNYKKWLHEVNQQIAETWNTSFMYMLPDKRGRAELWGYRPGKPPSLIKSATRQ